jgi:hypothetical protein
MGNQKLVMLIYIQSMKLAAEGPDNGANLKEKNNRKLEIAFCFIGRAISHLKGLKTIPLVDWIYRSRIGNPSRWKSDESLLQHSEE